MIQENHGPRDASEIEECARRGTAASVAEHLKIIAAKEYVKDRGSDGKT